ncbi:MAG: carbohydrate ABC transporter permease [Nitrososphaerales archaeon]
MKGRINIVVLGIILTIFLLFFTIPTIWIILTSIRDPNEINIIPIIWFPKNVTNINYIHAIFGYTGAAESRFLYYMFNSFLAASISTALALSIGTIAGYSFSRFRFNAKDKLFFILILVRAIPGISLSLPLLIFYNYLGLSDTIVGLALVYTALNTPFVTWMMSGFFDEIPKEIDEASYIDGCNTINAFTKVILPLTSHGLVATSIFIFLLSWNEFPIAFVLTTTLSSRTAPVGIFEFMSQFYIDWGGMAAASTLLMLPAFIFTYWVQKYIIRGLTFGAIKG